jgi:hypothetical protein
MPELQDMILYGMTLRLSAGYQSDLANNGKLGVIFEGTIFQPLWEREGAITDKLTLHCIVGMLEGSNNFIGQTFAGGVTQRKLVAQMAKACRQPFDASDIAGVDDKEIITRSTTYFGQPNDFLQYHATTNNALTWFSHMAAHINQLLVDETVPEIEYNDANGLIGTPQQTQNGVLCKVLLDTRLVIRGQIKLTKNVIVRQQVRTPAGEFPSILDNRGEYIVLKIRHYGDSRGNDWYSEFTAFVNNASLLALRTAF